jgi:O-antigen ligase
MLRLDERNLVRLYVLQLLLTVTYLVSDFVFAMAPQGLYFLLYFFELPGDAIGFEVNASRMGVRRFQSLYVVSTGFMFLLAVLYNLRDFFSRKALILMPVSAVVLAAGLFSGHRYLTFILAATLLFSAIAQRFFTVRNIATLFVMAGLTWFLAYSFAYRAPLAVQRVASVLPNPHHPARNDGASTMEARRMLRKIGMEMMPHYLWIGRGFGLEMNDASMLWDPTTITMHASQGRFFNGFVGLMVNTGVFGTLFMGIFLLAGTLLAWRIIMHLRAQGCNDTYSRMCAVLAGYWIASAMGFLFLHGDSEYAMKTFSLQAGMLLACERCLDARQTSASGAATE